MNIDTILFDLDGTLLDTNRLIHESFVYTLEQYGFQFSDEEILQFNGPPLVHTFTELNPEKVNEMVQTYRTHNLARHDDYVTLFPNVKETLAQLKQKGIKTAVVSAKMRPGVDKGLQFTGIEPYFDTIVTIDDVHHPKPHPESLQLAMDRLDSKQENTLMIGDNYHDIEAGNRAEVDTVAVSWTHKGIDFLKQYNPTYVIDDMKQLLDIVGV